jgi:hypothetical protein
MKEFPLLREIRWLSRKSLYRMEAKTERYGNAPSLEQQATARQAIDSGRTGRIGVG